MALRCSDPFTDDYFGDLSAAGALAAHNSFVEFRQGGSRRVAHTMRRETLAIDIDVADQTVRIEFSADPDELRVACSATADPPIDDAPLTVDQRALLEAFDWNGFLRTVPHASRTRIVLDVFQGRRVLARVFFDAEDGKALVTQVNAGGAVFVPSPTSTVWITHCSWTSAADQVTRVVTDAMTCTMPRTRHPQSADPTSSRSRRRIPQTSFG